MSANAVWRTVFRTGNLYSRYVASTSVIEPIKKEITKPKPKPGSTPTSEELKFDEKTHTGQAWDEEDYRLARFTYKEKQVNPNVAMNLIADIPPRSMKERVAACDGGGGALGHPKIYINLDKPGNHACGYCGLRFFKEDVPRDGSEHIQV